MDGFGYPIDVHHGSVFLGTLEAESKGVYVSLLQTPLANITVSHENQQPCKNMEEAAVKLLAAWKRARTISPYDSSEDWKKVVA
jgi:hypothetical protein